jgi:hypothetical protein
MKWLVSLSGASDVDAAAVELSARGYKVMPEVTPIHTGEKILRVEGPENLPDLIRDLGGVSSVYPDTEFTYY